MFKKILYMVLIIFTLCNPVSYALKYNYTVTDLKRIVIKNFDIRITLNKERSHTEYKVDYCTYNQERKRVDCQIKGQRNFYVRMEVDTKQHFKKNDKIVQVELIGSFHDNIIRKYVSEYITYMADFTSFSPGTRGAPHMIASNLGKIKVQGSFKFFKSDKSYVQIYYDLAKIMPK
ncbi:hypothetical protein PIROE2DRAFT_4632 [Piromyces sp. E2]|nr:hypothetical protein PIROE2DRAFT_4632 [Piromyces sp. E2]|eukprot:OUM67822.1 hypothetical protein PIROE2DRAFT_4632 [Piromyces sp. E2]